MTKVLSLTTSEDLPINLVDESVVVAIDVGEIPFEFAFPFIDAFNNNINGWQSNVPPIVGRPDISNGALNFGTPNFGFLRQLFRSGIELGVYQLTIVVSEITGSVNFPVEIQNDVLGAGTTLYNFVPDVAGNITATGTFIYRADINADTFTTTTDLVLSRNSGTSISITDIDIRRIGNSALITNGSFTLGASGITNNASVFGWNFLQIVEPNSQPDLVTIINQGGVSRFEIDTQPAPFSGVAVLYENTSTIPGGSMYQVTINAVAGAINAASEPTFQVDARIASTNQSVGQTVDFTTNTITTGTTPDTVVSTFTAVNQTATINAAGIGDFQLFLRIDTLVESVVVINSVTVEEM